MSIRNDGRSCSRLRTRTGTMLVAVAAILGSAAAAQEIAPPTGITWDFETRDLRGWTPTGRAFAFQPTLGDNPTARNRGQPSNHRGRYWIGTFERYGGRRGQSPGDTAGDGPIGTLTSLYFTVPGGTLTFLVGGGSDPRTTRVELAVVVDPIEGMERSELVVSGRNTETMSEVTWNLEPFRGRRARLRIVDSSSVGWGHINADDFRFSQWEPRVEVPDVSALTSVEAQQRLESAGLVLGRREPSQLDPRSDSVVAQRPPPRSSAVRGSAVTLYVVERAQRIRRGLVPDLLGVHEGALRESLAVRDLRLGAMTESAAVAPRRTVVAQRPPPRSEADSGSAVSVVLADPQLVIVPPLRGLPVAVAERELQRAGLVLGRADPPPADVRRDTVVDQRPLAGDTVPYGTPVDVVVGQQRDTGPPPQVTVVPDVRSLTLAEARRQLGAARLEVGQVQPSPDARLDSVVGQTPLPETTVAPGTAVELTLAARPTGPDGPPPPRSRLPWGVPVLVLLVGASALLVHRRRRVSFHKSTLRARAVRDAKPGDVECTGELVEVDVRLRVDRNAAGRSVQADGLTIREEQTPRGGNGG